MSYNIRKIGKDYHAGRVIQGVSNDIVDEFSENPLLAQCPVRAFGSLGKACWTGEVAPSRVYDFDIGVFVPDLGAERVAEITRFFNGVAGHYDSSEMGVEAKVIQGPIKLKAEEGRRNMLLHILVYDQNNLRAKPKPYVRFSMKEYGTQIFGSIPTEIDVARVGLLDVLSEVGSRFKTFLKDRPLNYEFDADGNKVVLPAAFDLNSLEFGCYTVMNQSRNLLAAVAPYIGLPHFDNSPEAMIEFARVFRDHPAKHLPAELYDLKLRERRGEDVDVTGLKGEVLNFLAFNDQMIRNMVGVPTKANLEVLM